MSDAGCEDPLTLPIAGPSSGADPSLTLPIADSADGPIDVSNSSPHHSPRGSQSRVSFFNEVANSGNEISVEDDSNSLVLDNILDIGPTLQANISDPRCTGGDISPRSSRVSSRQVSPRSSTNA